MSAPRRFWEQPLETLDRAQWEALCDGCGKCCLLKLEDPDSGEVQHSNVACRLLDLDSIRCSDYRRRQYYVPDCIRLTPRNLPRMHWLPATCAYRLRAEDQPLPEWHPLRSGNRDAMHAGGHSVRGRVVSETVAGRLEDHLINE
jgi:uncharacterized cysteine cluster protein YcgN (CxxCxxCC family)